MVDIYIRVHICTYMVKNLVRKIRIKTGIGASEDQKPIRGLVPTKWWKLEPNGLQRGIFSLL